MAVTAQQVFDMAIHLIDEQSESTGTTMTEDTDEYRYRTISILNTAIPTLYPYSSNYTQVETGRPEPDILLVTDYQNPDLTQVIALDDTLCLAILPYYLAGWLLAGENTELSDRLLSRYRESLLAVRDKLPAKWEQISTPYGLF